MSVYTSKKIIFFKEKERQAVFFFLCCLFVLFCVIFFFFSDMVSLRNPGWPLPPKCLRVCRTPPSNSQGFTLLLFRLPPEHLGPSPFASTSQLPGMTDAQSHSQQNCLFFDQTQAVAAVIILSVLGMEPGPSNVGHDTLTLSY